MVADAGAPGPRLLVLTNMWPEERDPVRGSFIAEQIEHTRPQIPDWTVDVMEVDGRKGRLEYLRSIGRLRRRLRSVDYDLIHAHYGLTGAVAAAQSRVPFVLTLHGSDVYIRWQRWISLAAARRARRVIYVSERLRDRAGGRAGVVIPCGVDLERFRPLDRSAARARLGLPDDGPLVLFPGDPARPVKDHALFAAAMNALPSPWRERARALVLGDVRPEDVPAHINAADAVLLTSRYEGAGSVVKEALACGVPVVTVDVGDAAAMIAGVDGCRLSARDPAALAAALAETLERGGRIAGRERLLEAGVDAAAVAHRVAGVYRDALGTGR